MNKKRSLMRSIAAAPHIFWAILFIVLPLLIVIVYAFTDPEGAFTLENVTSLKDYVSIFGLSIELSVIATFICLLVGYPLAYIIARSKPQHQKIFIMLLMLPMWTNLLIRTYSLMALLDDGGFINTVLGTSFHIVGTKGAVIFGMVYDFLPYMVLPIYTCVSKIDKHMWEVASDLGCNTLTTLTKVISQKLGGGTFELIGDTIERQFVTGAYNVGAAISLVMMILILISLGIMNYFTEENEGGIVP